MKEKLRVYAVEGHLVPHFERQAGKILAYVGRKAKVEGGITSFVATEEPDFIENRLEYRHYLKKGGLRAADKETARIAGVNFEAPHA